MPRRYPQFDLPEGEVRLEYPEPMSPESVDDLESFFALTIRRQRRIAAGAKPVAVHPGDDPDPVDVEPPPPLQF